MHTGFKTNVCHHQALKKNLEGQCKCNQDIEVNQDLLPGEPHHKKVESHLEGHHSIVYAKGICVN